MFKKNNSALIILFVSFLAVFCFSAVQTGKYTEGTLLAKIKTEIKLKKDIPPKTTGNSTLDSLNRKYKCTELKHLIPAAKNSNTKDNPLYGVYIFRFDSEVPIEQIIAVYQKSGLFKYVEPDYIAQGNISSKSAYSPNDQYFYRQWPLHNDATFTMNGLYTPKVDADIDMPEAWEIERGDSTVIIAILDSGCKMDHPELEGRLWTNKGEIPDNGIDDDNNGYVDDVHGWDFINDDNDPSDDNGHGTALAGIIGANSNNDIGFAGVNPNAKIMVIKVTDSLKTGNTASITEGINYATKMNVKLINLSLGLSNGHQTLNEAISLSVNNNITIISSSGNKNVNNIGYPATNNHVIAVGATGPDDKRFIFNNTTGSNYGNELDLVAPGMYICFLDEVSDQKFSTYSSGTSLSAAFVTGVVSLILSSNPGLTPSQIRDILHNSAEDMVGDPAEDTEGWDKYYGWGRLNAYNALKLASSVKNYRKRPQITISTQKKFIKIKNSSFQAAAARHFTLNGRISASAKNVADFNTASGFYIYQSQENNF